jgi:hypothetical protein
MGKDDAWRRFREREDEKENDSEPQGLREKRLNTGPTPTQAGPGPTVQTQDVDKLIQLIEPLIEQVGNLYAQYFAGVEKRPPLEKRRLLDSWVAQLVNAPKTTPSTQFRAQTIIQRHQTHKERWDRMLKERESK